MKQPRLEARRRLRTTELGNIPLPAKLLACAALNKKLKHKGDYTDLTITMESIFSQEQVDKLTSWKSALQTDNALSWKAIEDRAEVKIHNLLENSNFSKGSNLTEANIDQLFHLMRNFSANRALSNLLYKDNTIEIFNQKLRVVLWKRTLRKKSR